MIDVVIVGGGPVGLAAAIEARLAGLSAAVIEPRTGPIDKACGEGLMPGALPLLDRLGVHPAGHPLLGVGYYAAAHPHRSSTKVPVPVSSAPRNGNNPPERALMRSVEHLFLSGNGLGVRRTVLHEALSERAALLGVDLISGRADAIEQHEDSVTVAVGSNRIEARWLFGCDGLHSSVARLVGLARPARPGDRRYGIRQHFALAPWTSLIEVHYGPTAELYVTPVAADLVGIAMLAPQGTSFDAALAAVPDIADRLVGAAVASERRGAGPFRQRTRTRTAGRVLLVGDASGYVDALTGEGLRLGFAQASAAVVSVVDGRPQRYEGEWRRVTRDFRALTTGLVAWADSPLRGTLVPTAARLPGVFGAVVERLAR
ncbi:NAD(P)/FAD-dependent oxidoreductase [Homoserinimonas sp. A447]